MEKTQKEKEHFDKRIIYFEERLKLDPSNKINGKWIDIYKEKAKKLDKKFKKTENA